MILMFQPSNRLEEPPITNAPCLLLSLRVTRLWSVAPDSAQSVTTFVGQLRANLIERRSVDLLRVSLPNAWKRVVDNFLLMQRELCTFPLASNYLHKLSSAGYITVDDLKDVTPTELSEGKSSVRLFTLFPLVLFDQPAYASLLSRDCSANFSLSNMRIKQMLSRVSRGDKDDKELEKMGCGLF